jgi:hypothetical protein
VPPGWRRRALLCCSGFLAGGGPVGRGLQRRPVYGQRGII